MTTPLERLIWLAALVLASITLFSKLIASSFDPAVLWNVGTGVLGELGLMLLAVASLVKGQFYRVGLGLGLLACVVIVIDTIAFFS
jgi:hypothetical protein